MPEFFTEDCRYQIKAQPYLAAIAAGVKTLLTSRQFLLLGTEYEQLYASAEPFWEEQWQARGKMRCPFWTNYWFEPCRSCDCRIEGSVPTEIDALFFLGNDVGNTLAVHVEFKRDHEALSLGQAEAYRPRARCFRDQRRPRKGILKHDHALTVLFCGAGTDLIIVAPHFDRVISHTEAKGAFPGYPD
ncbi:hypothetical protein AC629_34730 [Bradyrhizobium sp. NAS80.1]|uniref:hypothetical protein n=1 Tax=Bradyrhizobium sp. NAS80.1 TaxID=1680159 RepID=UPI0009595351|nr:hypothetical protein [Bradyrhizobium sp. NAS80.1]OKO74665.1 hypothetical protein AC629_34730 [Bradyrhizobium sp. NAS80.1]